MLRGGHRQPHYGRKDKKAFSKTARKSHPKNNRIAPMRGGIRL